MPKTFILCSASLNSYGFRVMPQGIDLESFRKNPIMLYGHSRWEPPIGRWENLRMEGGNLLGDAIFDEKDEYAAEISRKVDDGFLNACSIGIDVVELSETDLIPGQYRPTVMKSRLFEVSIVDIPANADAVKLRFDRQGVTLSGHIEDTVLNQFIPSILISEMKKIALSLGLPEAATEQDILNAVGSLQAKAAKSIPALLALGRNKGIITDGNAKAYEALAIADFDATLSLIEQAPAPVASVAPVAGAAPVAAPETVKLNDIIDELRKNGGSQAEKGRDSWTLTDWRKQDSEGLARMQASEPEKFQKLFDAEYKK